MRLTITRCGIIYDSWFIHPRKVRFSREQRFLAGCFGLYFMFEWGVI